MRARIEYHIENYPAVWIVKINKIWIAYSSFWKALKRFPVHAYHLWNVGV